MLFVLLYTIGIQNHRKFYRKGNVSAFGLTYSFKFQMLKFTMGNITLALF